MKWRETFISGKQWLGNGLKDRRRLKRIALPTLALLLLFVAGRVIDIHHYLQFIQELIWRLGPWGPFVFGLIYVAATLLLMPGTPFTIIAALLFGTLWGYVTMLIATTVAAIIGFMVARYWGKELVEKKLANIQGADMLKGWVEANLWLAVPFIRIMPIFPFSLNNYVLGMTKISFWPYLLASEIIFIPMTGVFVFGASALYTAMIRGEISWGLILGTCVTGIVVLVLGLYGKRKLAPDGAGSAPAKTGS